MPVSQYYYPEVIRRLTISLMDMFNHIKVRRFEKDRISIKKEFEPPIRFGPADATWMQHKNHEECDSYYLTFPRFSLEWTGMDYASDRVYGADELRRFYDKTLGLTNLDEFWQDVNPTPYDFQFTLHVRTNSLTDFYQIIEQIYPYFNPDLYLRIKEFSFLNIERDIQVTIGSLAPDFLTEIEEDSKRYINADIPITCRAYLMRPISNAKIIKEIKTRFLIDNGVDNIVTSASDYSTSGAYETSAIPPLDQWEYDQYVGIKDEYDVSGFTSATNYT
jgi:hypothetical protein